MPNNNIISKTLDIKDIAMNHDVSDKAVDRVLEMYSREIMMNFNHLPETLLIAEFKGTKDTSAKTTLSNSF